jgi:hypothetical protein
VTELRPGDDGRLLTREDRIQAGREVWRILKRADSWVDEVFVGWPNLSPRYRQAGIEEIESRGLIEREPGAKGRHRIRLAPSPQPYQLRLPTSPVPERTGEH